MMECVVVVVVVAVAGDYQLYCGYYFHHPYY